MRKPFKDFTEASQFLHWSQQWQPRAKQGLAYAACLLSLLAAISGNPCMAASDDLIRLENAPAMESGNLRLETGSTIVLPDGRRTTIVESLPAGGFKTDLGLNVSQYGILLDGPDAGSRISVYHGQSTSLRIEKGMRVILPDGSQTVIAESLPDGSFKTASGIVISENGTILTGADAGKPILTGAANGASAQNETPQEANSPETGMEDANAQTAPVPDEDSPKEQPQASATQAGAPVAANTAQPSSRADDARPAPAQGSQNKNPASGAETPGAGENGMVTIADLLPTTSNAPVKQAQAAKDEKPAQKQKNSAPPKKAAEKSQASGQSASGKDAAVAKTAQEKKQKQETKKSGKVAPGENLRIPEEAIATGNLAFLEGCWQGTRPEYFSKRTIRECFCFGANGKNGKRRIYDTTYNRKCIGATKAKLSKKGVLSVTSQGAACSDGVKWGSAEMVCRNSGPRTPCSWVFMDANNGQQAYEIPFIRVESCGR